MSDSLTLAHTLTHRSLPGARVVRLERARSGIQQRHAIGIVRPNTLVRVGKGRRDLVQ